MFTQCPECDAIFQLTASQLKAANGDVRCGQCLSVFSALDHLSEDVPHTQEPDSTNEQAYDADPYSDWSGDVTSTTGTSNADHSNANADGDVFSEVIAEAGVSNIAREEIDRFEEFLATDELPVEDSPTLPDKNNEKSTETALPIEEFSAIDEAQPVESEQFSENVLPTTDESTINTDDTNFGDIDSVTVDLHTKVDIDDDEFAELDAYLNSTEDEYPDNIPGPIDTIKANEDTIFDNTDVSDNTDVEPVTSSANIDTFDTTPDTTTERPTVATDVDEPVAKQSSAQASSESEPQTINIPTLILDDLHAAKAEQMRPSNTPWVAGSLVLMIVLVLQVVFYSRDDLAKDASLRPWLIQMCDVFNCELKQPYDIRQIEIIGRDVRSHPTARKALVVSTTLINNADFIQPFPLLTMIFSDISGTKIAQRRFAPREYLHNDVDLEAGMTPDMPVRVELELVDPGKSAVNYEFRAEVDPRRTRPLS